MDWTALGLSLQLATASTSILFLVGLPLAWWLATSRFPGRWLVEAIVSLPLVLPPTVLGYYLLITLSPNGPVGSRLLSITGWRLPFSFAGILVGSVLCNLPFAVRPFTAALASVDRRLLEASWCLGVSRFATARRVAVPLAWPGIVAGGVLCFAHAIGEFGVVLMIGGNIPGVTRTLSISIYDDVQALHYARAGQTALGLVVFSLVLLVLVGWLGRRARGR